MRVEILEIFDPIAAAVHKIRNEGDQRVNDLLRLWAWSRDPAQRKEFAFDLHDIMSMGMCSDRQKMLIEKVIQAQEIIDANE